jgi:hypothetical protein
MSTLRQLAIANIAVHLVGLLVAALFLRPGSPTAPLAERMNFLAAHPIGWSAAWCVWIGCMILMVSFTFVAARCLEAEPLARLAVIVAVAAGGFDLLGDSLFIVVLPQVAALLPRNEQLFVAVERCIQTLSLVVANGLYSVATLLLTLAARSRLKRGVFVLGCVVFACGMLLALAAFTGVPWHAEAATGPTIGLYALWVWLAARDLEAR